MAQLHGSGLSVTYLRLGARAVLAQNLPLRDAPVLREAQRFREMGSPTAGAAWRETLDRLRAAVPESTFNIWLAPISLLGAKGMVLQLLAPDLIRTWVERRYSPLIREALQATGSGYTDIEFVSAGEGSTCR